MKMNLKGMILGASAVMLSAMLLAGCIDQTAVTPTPSGEPITAVKSEECTPTISDDDLAYTTDVPTPTPIPTQHVVSSYDQLCELGYNGKLKDGDTIRLTGDFEVLETIRLYRAVSFIIEGNINCQSYIEIENYSQAECSVTIGEGVDVSGFDLRYDMPKCKLTWVGPSPYQTEERLSEVMNVEKYNCTDLREKYMLGGISWKKITEVTATVKHNPSLSEDISWCIDGNKIYLDAKSINIKALPKTITLSVRLIDGLVNTEEFDISEDVFYTVKDCTYDTRVYKIVTDKALFENSDTEKEG